MFFVGRFITGVGVGISCFALPLYSAEISTASIRGATGSLFQLNVVAPRNEELDIIFAYKNLPQNGILSSFSAGTITGPPPKKKQVNEPCVGFPRKSCGCFLRCCFLSTEIGVCLTNRLCMPDSLGIFSRSTWGKKSPRVSQADMPGLKSGVGTQLWKS